LIHSISSAMLPSAKKIDHGASTSKRFNFCYNFELHHFADARVLETPTRSAFEEIRMKYPEVYIRNLVHENASLSGFKHNPQSFRYGVVDVPGNSHDEIMTKYYDVVDMLGYKFVDLPERMEDEHYMPQQPPPRAEGRSYQLDSHPHSSADG